MARTKVVDPDRADLADRSTELNQLAARLITAMASIRRTARLLAARPDELSILTSSQLDLVRVIRRRPGVSVADAANELRLAPNSVSTLVRQLTDLGVLIRVSDEPDRRVARLHLTPEMEKDVEAFRDRRTALLASGVSQLPLNDRRNLPALVSVLERLSALVAEELSDGG